MKNGYYLSCYVELDPIGNIYEYAHRHDQNISLWKVEGKNVSLIHYWELERLSGKKKHQISMFDKNHFNSICNDLLAEYKLSIEDIVDIFGTPGLGLSDDYLSIKDYPEFTYHTMCHLASCMFIDTEIYKNEKVLAFAVDGGSDIVADKETTKRKPFVGCYSDYKNHEFHLFPACSPAILWDYMSSIFGMQEGSLMALASASKSVVYYDMDDILLYSNLHVEQKVYDTIDALIDYVKNLTKEDAGIKFNYYDERYSEKENKISMVMKIIQQMSINIMNHNIDEAVEKFGLDTKELYLGVAGGFALNCPCNSYVVKAYQFKGFMAPPCVSDSGMSLGIGLYMFYKAFSGDFNFKFKSAYYGDSDDVNRFLNDAAYQKYIESVQEFDAKQVVKDIQDDPVVWFEGRAEVGPRALGARSLIGDPRQQRIKDRLNEIKLRQWWRPVAPIVLKDYVKDWFEEDQESPYMLHAIKIKEDKRNDVIAIVHEDGSARLQTIDETTDQTKLYAVLKEFYEETNVPIICNTSLNDKGEPIINQIDEAINFALRKKIKIVYINGTRIVLKNHELYEEKKPLLRQLKMLVCNEDQLKDYIKEYNPYNASVEVIFYYIYMKLDDYTLLRNERNVKGLKIRATMFLKTLNPFFRADLQKGFNNLSRIVIK